MSATAKQREEFVAILVTELPTAEPLAFVYIARQLMRMGASYLHWQEAACNRELTMRERTREARLEQQIQNFCKSHGIKPVFSGDSRGATVKLQFPSGRTNDWGQVGICVPTS